MKNNIFIKIIKKYYFYKKIYKKILFKNKIYYIIQ